MRGRGGVIQLTKPVTHLNDAHHDGLFFYIDLMIILLRHATPLIDYTACNFDQAKERMIQYNCTEELVLNETARFKNEVLSIISSSDNVIVYSSIMPRAIKTAQHLFESLKIELISEAIFSEFGLSMLKIPLIKLPLRSWFFLSRLAWFLGLKRDRASFQDEKDRSKRAARLLKKQHRDNTVVILVGHAFMNRFIQSHFKKDGWSICKRKTHKGCFEMSVLCPPKA